MRLDPPTDFQRQIAAALGIDITNDTREVAAARIHTFVGPAILSKAAEYTASERQIEFASALGLTVDTDSSLIASAKIADELFVRNKAALELLQLKPGDCVRVRHQFELAGEQREWVEEFVVSSVQPNGRIMFKGGNGRGAWPTEVEKVVEVEDTEPGAAPDQQAM
ncbi:MAG TPA: hypothetical protein VFV58_30910 [Blastocatellia bacterium]|jgi:hypothetical protein|nr:hypothetical protein [Blastocatellia bacterium]